MNDALIDRSLLYERRDAVVWLTIDRPEQRNALNAALLAALPLALETAQREPHARAVVITGVGNKAFCAGGDLKADLAPDYSKTAAAYAGVLRALEACSLPLVARINGHCLAGGMGLLAACDLAVAAEHALFGLPEVKVGLYPMQVTALLQRLVLPRVLAEMSLCGEPLTAHDAREAGLVNYVAAEAQLDEKTNWVLERLTTKSPTAQRRGKYATRIARDMGAEQALSYLETQFATLALTDDAREGRQAFAERRPPVWTGR